MNAPTLTRPHKARLRIENFLLLDGSGAFAEFSKTELIEGEIYVVNSQFQRHSYVKTELAFRLREATRGTSLLVLVEGAVAMPPFNMPEPDITVMHGPLGSGPILIETVSLIVEVSDTSLDIDLGRKAAIYARHGVADYWVVDVEGRQVHIHRQPGEAGYAGVSVQPYGTPLTSLAGLTIATDDLP